MAGESAIRWAWIRVVLGNLQMAGAVSSLILLYLLGFCSVTGAAVTATTATTFISIYLFRIRRVQEER